jgi:uncharacterized membrane protein YeaQ/YmgE (transglycosylase-associated protein family)
MAANIGSKGDTMQVSFVLIYVGAFAFGAVVGWITYFIMRRAQPTALTDVATIIGALGGAAILNLFEAKGPLFGAYAIGLAVGFFGFYIIYRSLIGKEAIRESLIKQQGEGKTIMGDERKGAGTS